MELLQLKYFLVTAKYQHMTKAAQVLRVAQPALSQSVKRLEQELGVSLFDREGRGICLNEAGRFLESRLLPLMAAFDELPQEVRKWDRLSRHTVRLNLLAATRLVTDAIISFKKLHPEADFRLVQDPDRLHDDLCLSTAFPGTPLAEDEQLLFREKFFIAVPSSSPYGLQGSVSLAELKREGFISLSHNRPIRQICDRFCLEAGFTPHTVCETDNPESVRNLIAAGLGVGFWPEYSWGLLSSPQVRLLSLEKEGCSRDIIVTFRKKSRESETAEQFFHFLTDFCRAADRPPFS